VVARTVIETISRDEYNRALLVEYRLRQEGSAQTILLQQHLMIAHKALEAIDKLGGAASIITNAALLELGYRQLPIKEKIHD
jgi:hypothetical protein